MLKIYTLHIILYISFYFRSIGCFGEKVSFLGLSMGPNSLIIRIFRRESLF